ncbi:hypothetical protein JCM16163A_41180 [Paenibacillus sp. YK5]
MSQLSAEIAQLEQQLTEAEERKQQYGGQDIAQYQKAVDDANNISAKLAQLREELAAEQESEQRVQQQEEKIASIELPYDFNEIFDNSSANDVIAEVVQTFLRDAVKEHNEEIEKLHQLYKEQLRAAGDRELQLQRQNEELQARVSEINSQLTDALDKNATLIFEKQDAEDKRDNAVAQLEQANAEIERLNGHIDDLRKDQAVGVRNGYKVIDSNSSLDELVAKAKEAKIKSAAELALEQPYGFRGKITLPEIRQNQETDRGSSFRIEDTATYPEHNWISAPKVDAPVTGEQFQVPTLDLPEAGPIEIPTQQPNGEVVAKTVEERLEALERAVFGDKGAVA